MTTGVHPFEVRTAAAHRLVVTEEDCGTTNGVTVDPGDYRVVVEVEGYGYAEAFREFETYAKLHPNEPNPHDSLAEAYMVHGDTRLAIDNYKRSLEFDPSNANAAEKLVELGKSQE